MKNNNNTDFGIQLNWQTINNINVSSLANDEIHIWWIPMDISKEKQEQFLPLLSKPQLAKLSRLPNEKLKTRYIAGRGYLHSLVAAYMDMPFDEIEFAFGKLGKPFLAPHLGKLHFNFSDTKGMGLFAFSKHTELGIDVEWAGRKGRFQQIMKRRFSKNEQHLLNSKNDAEQSTHFLSCWTRKEAYGKALGLGIRYPMREIDLCQNCNEPIFQLHKPDWTITQLALPNNFIGCLVQQGLQKSILKSFQVAPE